MVTPNQKWKNFGIKLHEQFMGNNSVFAALAHQIIIWDCIGDALAHWSPLQSRVLITYVIEN